MLALVVLICTFPQLLHAAGIAARHNALSASMQGPAVDPSEGLSRQLPGTVDCVSCTPSQTRLELAFYMESLCPFCKNFTTEQLAPMFKNGVADLVNIKLVAWGNARYDTAAGNWTCQHGPLECAFNALLSCAAHHYPEQDKWFPYLLCVEQGARSAEGPQDVQALHDRCAREAGLDHRRVWDCSQGQQGRELQLAARDDTDGLRPRHYGVPWVTLGHTWPASHPPTHQQRHVGMGIASASTFAMAVNGGGAHAATATAAASSSGVSGSSQRAAHVTAGSTAQGRPSSSSGSSNVNSPAGRRASSRPVPLYDAQDYVQTLVCAAYSGPLRLPEACYEEVPAATTAPTDDPPSLTTSNTHQPRQQRLCLAAGSHNVQTE